MQPGDNTENGSDEALEIQYEQIIEILKEHNYTPIEFTNDIIVVIQEMFNRINDIMTEEQRLELKKYLSPFTIEMLNIAADIKVGLCEEENYWSKI